MDTENENISQAIMQSSQETCDNDEALLPEKDNLVEKDIAQSSIDDSKINEKINDDSEYVDLDVEKNKIDDGSDITVSLKETESKIDTLNQLELNKNIAQISNCEKGIEEDPDPSKLDLKIKDDIDSSNSQTDQIDKNMKIESDVDTELLTTPDNDENLTEHIMGKEIDLSKNEDDDIEQVSICDAIIDSENCAINSKNLSSHTSENLSNEESKMEITLQDDSKVGYNEENDGSREKANCSIDQFFRENENVKEISTGDDDKKILHSLEKITEKSYVEIELATDAHKTDYQLKGTDEHINKPKSLTISEPFELNDVIVQSTSLKDKISTETLGLKDEISAEIALIEKKVEEEFEIDQNANSNPNICFESNKLDFDSEEKCDKDLDVSQFLINLKDLDTNKENCDDHVSETQAMQTENLALKSDIDMDHNDNAQEHAEERKITQEKHLDAQDDDKFHDESLEDEEDDFEFDDVSNFEVIDEIEEDDENNSVIDKTNKLSILDISKDKSKAEGEGDDGQPIPSEPKKKRKMITCDDLPKSYKNSDVLEIPGKDIENGLFTRVVIIGSTFLSAYNDTWPSDSNIKPYFLCVNDLTIKQYYKEFHDHPYLKGSEKIFVLFIIGLNDILSFKVYKARNCLSNHPEITFPKCGKKSSTKFFKVLINQMEYIKNELEANESLSVCFSYIPKVNFIKNINNLFYNLHKDFDDCSCFFTVTKESYAIINLKFNQGRETFNQLIFSKMLNKVRDVGFFEFLPLDLNYTTEWTVDNARLRSKIDGMSLDFKLKQFVFPLPDNKFTIPTEEIENDLILARENLLGKMNFKIIIIGDNWLQAILDNWLAKYKLKPFFYCQDGLNLQDIKEIILSLVKDDLDTLIITSLSSGDLFKYKTYAYCEGHEPLYYPVPKNGICNAPIKFAKYLCNKIDTFQEEMKILRKHCKIVFMTNYPPISFEFYYSYLTAHHQSETKPMSHKIVKKLFNFQQCISFKVKLQLCLKRINNHITKVNGENDLHTCDIFSLVYRLKAQFGNLIFPVNIPNKSPPLSIVTKLTFLIREYIETTDILYKKKRFSFKHFDYDFEDILEDNINEFIEKERYSKSITIAKSSKSIEAATKPSPTKKEKNIHKEGQPCEKTLVKEKPTKVSIVKKQFSKKKELTAQNEPKDSSNKEDIQVSSAKDKSDVASKKTSLAVKNATDSQDPANKKDKPIKVITKIKAKTLSTNKNIKVLKTQNKSNSVSSQGKKLLTKVLLPKEEKITNVKSQSNQPKDSSTNKNIEVSKDKNKPEHDSNEDDLTTDQNAEKDEESIEKTIKNEAENLLTNQDIEVSNTENKSDSSFESELNVKNITEDNLNKEEKPIEKIDSKEKPKNIKVSKPQNKSDSLSSKEKESTTNKATAEDQHSDKEEKPIEKLENKEKPKNIKSSKPPSKSDSLSFKEKKSITKSTTENQHLDKNEKSTEKSNIKSDVTTNKDKTSQAKDKSDKPNSSNKQDKPSTKKTQVASSSTKGSSSTLSKEPKYFQDKMKREQKSSSREYSDKIPYEVRYPKEEKYPHRFKSYHSKSSYETKGNSYNVYNREKWEDDRYEDRYVEPHYNQKYFSKSRGRSYSGSDHMRRFEAEKYHSSRDNRRSPFHMHSRHGHDYRYRSPHSRSYRSRSRDQTPPSKRRRSRSSSRVDSWYNKYINEKDVGGGSKHCSSQNIRDEHSSMEEKAIDNLWEIHNRECEMYRHNPVAHPDFEKVRRMWYEVMTSQGLNPYDVNMEVHWQDFWQKKMEQIFKDNWEDKKTKCLLLLSSKKRHQSSSPSSSSTSSSSSSDEKSGKRKHKKKKTKTKKSKKRKRSKRDCSAGASSSVKKTKDFLSVEALESRINAFMMKAKNEPGGSAPSTDSFLSCLGDASMMKALSPPRKKTSSEKEKLLDVTTILSQMADKFGALRMSLTSLHSKVLSAIKAGQNPLELIDEDAKMLLELIGDKIKRLLDDESLNMVQRAITKEAHDRLTTFLQHLEKKNEAHFGLDLDIIAKSTLGMQVTEVVNFIKNSLTYKRVQNVTNDDLMKIYVDVKAAQMNLVTSASTSSDANMSFDSTSFKKRIAASFRGCL